MLGSSAPRSTDVVAVAVAVVSTVVIIALCASVVYLLRSVRDLRREATSLAAEASRLLQELDAAAERAGAEVDRVGRMVGSAEAISDVVGSASRLVGGVVAEPLIKLVALGSGIAEGARHLAGVPQSSASAAGRSRSGSRMDLRGKTTALPGRDGLSAAGSERTPGAGVASDRRWGRK